MAATGTHGKVGIVAGGGQVPLHLARTVAESGCEPFIVMLEGNADPALARWPHVSINTAEPGRLLSGLRKAGVETVVLAGSVKGRPDIGRFRPDWTTLRVIGRVARGLAKGDDALLRLIVTLLEEQGFRVAGAHQIAADLLAPHGDIAGTLSRREHPAIAEGVRAARMLGELDAGQAVVAIGGRIVALEGVEGTDAMLARVADLRAHGRIGKGGGVLVKLKKPQQDERVDLPTIGVQTVRGAAGAGLSGIVVEGEATLLIDADAVRRAAGDAGIFVAGIDPDAWTNG